MNHAHQNDLRFKENEDKIQQLKATNEKLKSDLAQLTGGS